MNRTPTIYLAGPGVFRPDAKDIGERLKALCQSHGLIGLWPCDNDPRPMPSFVSRAEYIYLGNVAMIGKCDAVVADISPFRGPHMDPGTAWEIGAAVALRKPVFAYTTHPGPLSFRVQLWSLDDGERRDMGGNLIEDFGLPENLMISCSVESISNTADEAVRLCAEYLRGQDAGA